MARYTRTELGILIPILDDPPAPNVPSAEIYISNRDLSRPPMGEEALVDCLGRLSAADCLVAIAHLSTRLFAQTRPEETPQLQRELAEQMLGDGELARAVLDNLGHGIATTAFFEQQLVHLARLVILHADRRPRDRFDDGALLEDWARCLIGVTDLLDAGLDIHNRLERLSWEIRQCSLNHHEHQIPSSALHYEVYRVIWPELKKGRYEKVEVAFQSHTGMTIGDYFTVGAAVLARLAVRGSKEPTILPAITPKEYFSSAKIEESTWQAFFTLAARDPDGLRDELRKERAEFGESTYGSLTFERFPLAEIEPGLYVPLSMQSLQRRVSSGVFHLLSEAAENEGKDRRTYSSRFGGAFQRSVEQTLRRGVAFSQEVSIVADERYGPRTDRRDSSDVILGYERAPVFIEVVSGPLQARTITRGDLGCFFEDANRLVVEKARQLDQCIQAFFDRKLELPGVDPATVAHVWPVIVTSHPFPHRECIIAAVEKQVRKAGHLQGERIGGLAIVSAEELFFCEGFMQQGRTFLSLIRGWKSGPHPDLSFRNHLIEEGRGRAPSSEHLERRFAEFNVENMNRVLGREEDLETALEKMRAGDSSPPS
jgi:hypothetical protein